jgi:hypothetical protein
MRVTEVGGWLRGPPEERREMRGALMNGLEGGGMLLLRRRPRSLTQPLSWCAVVVRDSE